VSRHSAWGTGTEAGGMVCELKHAKTFFKTSGMQLFEVFTLVATVFTAFIDDDNHVL